MNAVILTGQVARVLGDNTGATFTLEDPKWADNIGGHSVWYVWTAPVSGMATVSAVGVGFPALVNVVATANPAGFIVDQANVYAIPYGSPQWFMAQAGRTYHISVDGIFGQQGPFSLSLRGPPMNDTFENRDVIYGDNIRISGSLVGADRQQNEPNHTSSSDARWWSWTAPMSGRVTMSIVEGDPLTGVSVFTGTTMSNLTQIADTFREDDIFRSLTFDATEDCAYAILIDAPRETADKFVVDLELGSVHLTAPLHQDIFQAPANIVFAATTSRSADVREIQFFTGGNMVARVTNAANTAVWASATMGFHFVFARAIYLDGNVVDSPVAFVRVVDELVAGTALGSGPFSSASYLINSVGEAFAVGPPPERENLTTLVLPRTSQWRKIADDVGINADGHAYLNLQTRLPSPPDAPGWAEIARGRTAAGTFALGIDEFGEMFFDLSRPLPYISAVPGWASIACGFERAIALGNNGQVYTWGAELVANPTTALPTQVPLPGIKGASAVVSGVAHFLALGTNGQLFAWGDNSFGQLGVGDRLARTQPALVPRPSGVARWKVVQTGAYHTLAIGDNDQLYGWGRNWEHQTGLGFVPDQIQLWPLKVPSPPGVTGWVNVAAGTYHSFGMGSDLQLYAWGSNDVGQAGVGPSPRIATAVHMEGFPNPYPPASVRLQNPVSGDVVHLPAAVTITASANLPYGEVQRVEFFANDLKIGETNRVPISIIWTNASSGRYWLKARATDSLGSTTISSAVDLRVNTLPSVTLRIPNGVQTIVAGENITLAATPLDSDGTILGVGFAQDETIIAAATRPPYAVTLSNIPPGQFVYRARVIDNLGGQAVSAPVTVESIPNQPPSFNPGPDVVVLEDGGEHVLPHWATAIGAGADHESGQVLQFHLATDQQHLFAVQPRLSPDGTLTFAAAPDANGLAVVSVELSDSGGTAFGGRDRSVRSTFSIRIEPVNDAPVFQKGADVRIAEDTGPITLSAWATQIASGPPDESAQVVGFDVKTDNPAIFALPPSITADGTLSFVTAPDMHGTAVVSVMAIDDGGTENDGQASSTVQSFAITITAINDRPTFLPGVDQIVNEDAGIQRITNWADNISSGPDNERGQSLRFVLTNDNPGLFTALSGQPTIDLTGTLIFTPASNAHGTSLVAVLLQDDGGTNNGGSDTSMSYLFTITVVPSNDPPVVEHLTLYVDEDSEVTFRLPASDIEGDTLSFSIGVPHSGTLSGSEGEWTYKPNSNFFGNDSFTFTVSDGQLDSSDGLVRLVVVPVNDPPVARISIAGAFAVAPETEWIIIISANGSNAVIVLDGLLSSDEEGDPIEYFWFHNHDEVPFAEGIAATNFFDIGLHQIMLTASDGTATSADERVVQVIPVGQAIEQLVIQIDENPIVRRNKRPLISTLKAAIASFDRNDPSSGLGQLAAFQNKVRAQIAPAEPELAALLERTVQQIIDGLLVSF